MKYMCGIDLVYISKLLEVLKNDELLNKFFHGHELANKQAEHLAGVLAAKEAYFKAIGAKPKFLEIEVQYETSGRPFLVPSPDYQKFGSCDVSISHDGEYAVAMVVLSD